MTSAVKSFLVLLVILPLLIYIGSEVGSEEYFLPVAVGLLIIFGMIIALFFRSQRLECLILTFLIGGYLVGSRGFAQLYVVQPLFVGELGLACIIAILVLRYAVTREFIVPQHWLSALLGVYLGYALIRLFVDYPTYGIDAVRDTAIVYYCLFFFFAYQLGRRDNVGPFVNRAMLTFIVLQALVAVVFIVKPEWLELVEIRGVPVLLQKPDLTGTFAAAGAIFLSLHPELLRARWIRRGLILLLVACVITLGSRAATVGMLCALALIWVSGRRGFVLIPAMMGVFGLIFLLTLAPLVSERFVSVQEEFASIVDFSGTHSYNTDFGEEKRADNRFRLELWQSMYEQTVHDNWAFGKGFGYDFLPIFEREFNGGHWEGLRSAHNYFVTAFGRLGTLGILVMMGIVYCVVRHGVLAAQALRRKETTDTQSLSFWCLGVIIVVSGTFGVVMEGPMGAIPMWSFFGFALAADDRRRLQEAATEEVKLPLVETDPIRQRPMPKPALAR